MHSDGSPPNTSVRAFPSHASPDRYFAAGAAEESRERLLRCVERGDGPAALIGAAGMGKTMLLGVLAEALENRFAVVSISSTQLCTRRALLQAVLFGLGMPYQNREEGELRLALVDRLRDEAECPRGAVLLIDEAQALPVRLLEELRILSNLARDGEPLVRLVLAGSTALEEQLASTDLESLNQRITARCYLAPLGYEETRQYVRAHLAAAGADPDSLFLPASLDAVYSATDGVPRLINQLCDRAIVLATDRGVASVDASLIQAAWSDLHQLPAPWHTPEVSAFADADSSVVEFGVLAEGEDDPLGALPFETPAGAEAPPAGVSSIDEPVGASVAADPPPVDLACEPAAGDWNADEALAEVATDAVVRPDQPAPTSEDEGTPDAATLFGDGFDEEEVVIDRFAALDAVLPSTAPTVTNIEDADFSVLVGRHTIAEPTIEEPAEGPAVVESSAEDSLSFTTGELPSSLESLESLVSEPLDGGLESLAVLPMGGAVDSIDDGRESTIAASDPAEVAVQESLEALAAIESDILVIEPDQTQAADAGEPAVARRQEYRQLFANLRRS